jgi:hypothetical protein
MTAQPAMGAGRTDRPAETGDVRGQFTLSFEENAMEVGI